MEKLIELLNEYNRTVLKWADTWKLKDSIDNPWTKYISLSSVWAWKIYLWIISREYWFIKWLVENDKIDLDKVEFVGEWTTKYQSLLMLLSISDTPIEDLISYLR
jgi:hypothetical protein